MQVRELWACISSELQVLIYSYRLQQNICNSTYSYDLQNQQAPLDISIRKPIRINCGL